MKKLSIEIRLLAIMVPMMIVVAALVIGPAWSLDYWQGWLFLASLYIPMLCVMVYMLMHERKLLEKRINPVEKREPQVWVQFINTFLFIAAMVIAGLDHRFGWSRLPVWAVFTSDAMMLAGYYAFIRIMLYNEYASRTIEIQKGQKLISTGPYAVIRHPMYTAGIFMYIFVPLVLGSLWALIPILMFPITLAFRIIDEEKALIKGLKGYRRYMKKVKYRLIPFIW
jgi:protein-S-isoprenylcysteine O-methyltransferase Ste14